MAGSLDSHPISISSPTNWNSVETIVNENTPLLSKQTGRSSFLHSTLKTVNLMVGMSLLSLPYTLKLGGWVTGIGLILAGGITTLYTALKLIQCFERSPISYTLGDLAEENFGKRGRFIVSCLYVFELVSCGISYIIVFGDSMQALVGQSLSLSITEWKVIGISIFLLTSIFENNRSAFIASTSGVLASVCLLLICVYDVLFTQGQGSVWTPAETRMFPEKWSDTFVNLGIVIYTYSGHSVLPTIYREMNHPERFTSMILLSYSALMIWLLGVPSICYLAFGNDLLDEVGKFLTQFTLNLWANPNYNKPLNGMLLWLIIITATSKYSMIMQPVVQVFARPQTLQQNSRRKNSVIVILGLIVFSISVIWPSFSVVISFVGAVFSFLITMAFPSACYLTMFGNELSFTSKVINALIIVASIMGGAVGAVGTYTQFNLL